MNTAVEKANSRVNTSAKHVEKGTFNVGGKKIGNRNCYVLTMHTLAE